MMPLSFVNPGEAGLIKKVGGNPGVRKHLESLGLIPGGKILVISKNNGNMILNVKESRIAISREMAGKVMV